MNQTEVGSPVGAESETIHVTSTRRSRRRPGQAAPVNLTLRLRPELYAAVEAQALANGQTRNELVSSLLAHYFELSADLVAPDAATLAHEQSVLRQELDDHRKENAEAIATLKAELDYMKEQLRLGARSTGETPAGEIIEPPKLDSLPAAFFTEKGLSSDKAYRALGGLPDNPKRPIRGPRGEYLSKMQFRMLSDGELAEMGLESWTVANSDSSYRRYRAIAWQGGPPEA